MYIMPLEVISAACLRTTTSQTVAVITLILPECPNHWSVYHAMLGHLNGVPSK
jgi:hypothetical protein